MRLCEGHYRRLLNGRPLDGRLRGELAGTCIVADCGRKTEGHGFCTAHYQRWKQHGDPLADIPIKVTKAPSGSCEVEGCEGQYYAGGYCRSHYARLVRGVEVDAPLHRRTGEPYFDRHHGYMLVTTPLGTKRHHRVVMEAHLNRALLPGENVHHRNGDRTDNRLENLELWSTGQPPGQRVLDKVRWAHEIIATYEADIEAGLIT